MVKKIVGTRTEIITCIALGTPWDCIIHSHTQYLILRHHIVLEPTIITHSGPTVFGNIILWS